MRQSDVAGADGSDEMGDDTGRLLTIKLIKQAARDQYARLSARAAHRRRVDIRRVDQQKRGGGQACGNPHFCDDIRNLVFFLVAQVGRPGVQAGNQIAAFAAKRKPAARSRPNRPRPAPER